MFSSPSSRSTSAAGYYTAVSSSTPSKRGGGRGGRGSGRGGRAQISDPRRGLFEDGAWLCDCRPRLPALHLQVKKDTPNKGKWFYTCQDKKCGFFLFAQDAQIREESALINNNSRSENGITTNIGTTAPPKLVPGYRSVRLEQEDEPPPYSPAGSEAFAGSRDTSPAERHRGMGPPDRLKARSESVAVPARNMHRFADGTDYSEMGSDTDEEWELASLADRHSREYAEELAQQATGGTSLPSAQVVSQMAPPTQTLCESIPISWSVEDRPTSTSIHNSTPSTPSKRKLDNTSSRRRAHDSDDEYSDSFNSDDEQLLIQLTDASAKHALEKAARDPFTTPSKPWTAYDSNAGGGGAYPTPQTRHGKSNEDDDEDEPSVKRHKNTLFADSLHETSTLRDDYLISPGVTPLTKNGRHFDALAEHPYIASASAPVPAPPSPSSTISPSKHDPSFLIADAASCILQKASPRVDTATSKALRDLLLRHERRVQGVVRGRDAARVTLEAREGRIAELQARVTALENERRVSRARLKDLSSGLLRLSQEEED